MKEYINEIITFVIGGGLVSFITYIVNFRNNLKKSKAEADAEVNKVKTLDSELQKANLENIENINSFWAKVFEDQKNIINSYKEELESRCGEIHAAKVALKDANDQLNEMNKSIRELTFELNEQLDKARTKINMLKSWIEETTPETLDTLKSNANAINYEKF